MADRVTAFIRAIQRPFGFPSVGSDASVHTVYWARSFDCLAGSFLAFQHHDEEPD